jgi:hypothetical protein
LTFNGYDVKIVDRDIIFGKESKMKNHYLKRFIAGLTAAAITASVSISALAVASEHTYSIVKSHSNQIIPYDNSSFTTTLDVDKSTIRPELYITQADVEYSESIGGSVQTVEFTMQGTQNSYSAVGLNIYYDDRLTIKPDNSGKIAQKCEALSDMDFDCKKYVEGQLFLSIYSGSGHGSDGAAWTVDFVLPSDASVGDVYPIGVEYYEDEYTHDCFQNVPSDDKSDLMEAWFFKNGIHNGYIRICEKQTEPPTDPVTDLPTDPVTDPPTDPVTEPPTDPVTDPPTDPVTEPPTDPVTEPPTDPVTDPPTDPVTDPPTDPVTDPPTDPVTDPPTDPVTVPPTDPVTEPPTDPVTESPTDPVTEPPTDPVTEPPTAPVTDPPTDPVTDPPTDPVTQPNEKEYSLGDVDGNGRINTIDATKVLREVSLLANNKPGAFNDKQWIAADLNFDGRINVTDATLVMRYCAYLANNPKDNDILAWLASIGKKPKKQN